MGDNDEQTANAVSVAEMTPEAKRALYDTLHAEFSASPETAVTAEDAEHVETLAVDSEVDPAGDAPTSTGQKLRMPVMALEGVETGDGRKIAPEALGWRDLPLPVMALTKTTFGHDQAELVGKITEINRIDASGMINSKTGEPYGEGVFALEAVGDFASVEYATQVADLIRGQFIRGVSIDIGDVTTELEFLPADGEDESDEELDLFDLLFMDGDVLETVTAGRVMGVTICPFPAFEGAYVQLEDGESSLAASQLPYEPADDDVLVASIRNLDEFGTRSCASCEEGLPLVASAGPIAPPLAWFSDPELDGPTPLTIDDDGRVYGHLALWNTCHTGVMQSCVIAPHSMKDYADFQTGAVMTAEGSLVSVGNITVDTGHANLALNKAATLQHYDNTGTQVADIACGEDRHGIWFSGAMRPDVTEAQIRKLRASALSGDWRQVRGNLELVAALAVSVPGFPVPRSRVASGAPQALIAAGGHAVPKPNGRVERRAFTAVISELTDVKNELRADRLRRRLHKS